VPDDSLLDALEATPLPPVAGQRVAVEVASHLPDLTKLEESFILRFKSEQMSQSEFLDTREQIWSTIGSIGADPVKNARDRLIMGMVQGIDKFDDQFADMIYHWAKIVGIDDEAVTAAIQSELARW
jgi:hypothetical protein